MPVKITINFSDPVDPDAFVSHYVNTHVPLVNDLWVTSMTFDSEEAMHAAFASEAGAKTIADMPNYKARSWVSVVSEV